MIIDKNKIKLWSSIGSRASFGLAAFEIAKNNNKLMIVTADVSTSAGLDRYKKKYPNNYVDVGIGEQNMMSVASGLASEGFDVITTTFSPFQTLRCAEQIKVNLGYMKNKVVMVGLASGLILGNLGFTHCSIEDIGILRSIPNLTIISPADSFETVKAVLCLLLFESVMSFSFILLNLFFRGLVRSTLQKIAFLSLCALAQCHYQVTAMQSK